MSDSRTIIAGAGPVGLTTALLLVEQGMPVTLLEKLDALPEDMRASTFHAATLDMLAPGGLAARLIEQGTIVPKWQYRHHETGDSIIFDFSVLDGLTDHPYRLQCEQFRLTRAIVERLQGNPLFDIRFNAAVSAIGQDADTAWAEADIDGRRQRISGAYLVAADGGRSTIRELMNLDFDGETYGRTSITVVVDFPFHEKMPGLLPVNYLWTHDDHFSLMQVGKRWRVGFSPRPEQSLEEAASRAGVEARLQAILPNADAYRIDHIGAYTVHRRVIDNFRHGRILFAGDAAHVNSPSGGMGMNSGIHDASSLAAHLLDVLQGADASLLDRYSRRRRTIAIEEVQKQSDANYRRHREKDPEARKAIWQDLRDIVADRQRMRDYLYRASMLASVERSNSIM